jgi:hypothetical protein
MNRRGPKPGTMTAERRAAISAATKEKMADPAIRAKISRRTKDGILSAQGGLYELRDLRTAWKRAQPHIRRRFFSEVIDGLWLKADSDHPENLSISDSLADKPSGGSS